MEVPVDFENDLSISYTYSVTFLVRLQTNKIQCTICGQKYLATPVFFFFKSVRLCAKGVGHLQIFVMQIGCPVTGFSPLQ